MKTTKREQKLLDALEEISKGYGAYNLNPLTHCSNAVVNMKSIAEKAIKNHKK